MAPYAATGVTIMRNQFGEWTTEKSRDVRILAAFRESAASNRVRK
jgi:hypothetical protein